MIAELLGAAIAGACVASPLTFALMRRKPQSKPHYSPLSIPTAKRADVLSFERREVEEPTESKVAPFSVAGPPKPAPWRFRRREIESQHRTKRKAREEFREA